MKIKDLLGKIVTDVLWDRVAQVQSFMRNQIWIPKRSKRLDEIDYECIHYHYNETVIPLHSSESCNKRKLKLKPDPNITNTQSEPISQETKQHLQKKNPPWTQQANHSNYSPHTIPPSACQTTSHVLFANHLFTSSTKELLIPRSLSALICIVATSVAVKQDGWICSWSLTPKASTGLYSHTTQRAYEWIIG